MPVGLMFQLSITDVAVAGPAGAVRVGWSTLSMPVVLSSVSAYRFWLNFIIVVASMESGGDWYVMSGIAALCVGGVARSSISTAGPRTSMPPSMSARRSAVTK